MTDLIFAKPEQIKMFGLLQLRGRLHLEIKLGLPFSNRGPGTLAILKAQDISTSRRKWTALWDLNRYIAASGGPSDSGSLALQRWLAQHGKPHEIPTRGPTVWPTGKP